MRKVLLTVILIFLALYWSSYLTKKVPENAPPIKETRAEQATEQNDKTSSSLATLKDISFPDNFFFGSAYSDFQTAGISEASDWYEYVQKMKPPQVGPGVANDFFNRYKEDFDLAGKIGIQVHRISLDWARIEPEEGKYNMAVVQKWKEVFSYMKTKGIEPMICLNHFPHPKWFAEKGGWESPEAPQIYAGYAKFLAKNIGIPLRIKWWLTFNEPQFIILVPYAKGSWPPFKEVKDLRDQRGLERLSLVASRVLDGHRLAYRTIHSIMDSGENKIMVGFASATGAFFPFDPESLLDQVASTALNVLYGTLIDYSIGSVDRDFVGINYYGRIKLRLHISLWNQVKSWLTEDRPFAIEWINEHSNRPDARPKEFYPQALYDIITKFKALNKPIIITENGLDDDQDRFREEFIIIHLKAVHDAIRDGADVIGYQYWALTDTWEPGDASFSHMGLIRIDRENNTLNRTLRPSANTYTEIIQTHTISKQLLEKHKELLPKN